MDEMIWVNPDEVEVEVQPTTPSRPKKKTPPTIPTKPVGDSSLSLVPFVTPESLVKSAISASPPPKQPERIRERRKETEIIQDLASTGKISQEEKSRLVQPKRITGRPLQREEPDVTDIAIEVGRGLGRTIGTTATEIPRGVGATLDLLSGLAYPGQEFKTERYLGKLSDIGTKAVEEATPLDPQFDQSFLVRDIPSAFGSAVTFLAGGMVGKALKVPSLLSTAGLGGVINVAEVAKEADTMGIDPSRRKLAVAAALGSGITEAAGLGRALDKFGLKQPFTRRMIEIAEEGGQEALQQWLNNLNAIFVGGYDQDRDSLEGVLKGAILGGVVGGGFQGLSLAKETKDRLVSRRQEKETPTEEVGVPRPRAPQAIDQLILNESKTLEDNKARLKNATAAGLQPEVERLKGLVERSKKVITDYYSASEISDQLSNTYEFFPSQKEGQSPYLVIPNWMAAAISNPGQTMGSRGVTVNPQNIEEVKADIIKYAPSLEYGNSAIAALDEAMARANQQALSTVALVNRDGILIGLGKETPSHETLHVGQYTAALAGNKEITSLHSPDWATNNPYIRRMLDTAERTFVEPILVPEIRDEDLLAVELPAYIMSGHSTKFFDSTGEAIDFVMAYFENVLKTSGVDALNTIDKSTLLIPEREDIIPLVRSMYETWIREKIDDGTLKFEQGYRLLKSLTPRSNVARVAPSGPSQGPSSVTGQGTGGTVGNQEQAPVSRDLRDYNLDRFLEGSSVSFPVYHGTNANVDFDTFSKSGDLGFHFGTEEAANRRLENTAKSIDPTLYPLGEPRSELDATYGPDARVGSYYLSLKNPLKVPDIFLTLETAVKYLADNGYIKLTPELAQDVFSFSTFNRQDESRKKIQDEVYRQLEAKGYDGFEYVNDVEGTDKSTSYVVFRPNQIKSAIGNVGTFDSSEKSFMKAEHLSRYESEARRMAKENGLDWNQMASYDKATYIDEARKIYERGREEAPEFQQLSEEEYARREREALENIKPRGMMAQWPEEIKVGDTVKVKGYANQAEVIRIDPDGRANVKFPDGTEDKFKVSDLYPVTSKVPQATPSVTTPSVPQSTSGVTSSTPGVTPPLSNVSQPKPYVPPKKGVVPSLPGRMRIKKTPMWVDRIGPGDTPGTVKVQFGDGTTSQFDLEDVRDASGKKIKDPLVYMLVEDPPSNPTPPPPKPPYRSYPAGGPYPSLMVEGVNVAFQRPISRRFSDLLENNNINYDFSKPPALQVYEALIEGTVRDEDVENVLNDEGVSWEDFAEDIYSTYSRAGATLQTLSDIVQRHWVRLKNENLALFNKLVSPSRQINMVLEDLNKTVLGMSLWRRSGRLLQKATLTQYATAMVNFMGATGRVPLDATAAGLGQMVQGMVEGKGKFAQRTAKARDSAYETFLAGFEAWRALNPTQLQDLFAGRLGSNYEGYETILVEIKKYFPDIYQRLFSIPMEVDTKELKDADNQIKGMNTLLNKIESRSTRKDLQQRIAKLRSKVNQENSVLMRVGMRGPEAFFDFFLKPMQFGEFLMRRPQFISRLRLELKDRGIDMNQILRNTHLPPDQLASLPPDQRMTFAGIPADALKAALDSALEFTMALDPSRGPDARLTEIVGQNVIKTINALGPLSLLTDLMFPRAIFSAAKTFYDYSSLPFMFEWAQEGSFRRISNQIFGKGLATDPKTGEKYLNYPPSRADYERLGRAFSGTFLYAVAFALLKYGLMGDEWYELKTGRKDRDGKPIYDDIRKFVPFAKIFQLVSLVDRFANNRMNDIQAGAELLDIVTGMKRYGNDQDLIDMIDAVAEYWSGPERNPFTIDKVNQLVGKYPAAFLTPFLNLRSIVAAYDEDENVRKDLRGYGFWGPSMDKIPWLRRQLPDLTYPTFKGKMELSQDPLLQQFAGVSLIEAPIFMGREFKRMGINIREYLPKDSDPAIDRLQNKIFSYLMESEGKLLEKDPEYRNASDAIKAAMWENLMMGPGGIVSLARQGALDANPMEAARRRLMKEMPGRFMRQATGLAEELEQMRKVR
jgi:hypothetical protein